MKIVKYLEESSVLIKCAVKQLKMKQNYKKVGFLACLGILGAGLLGNMLADKGVVGGDGVIWAAEGTNRVGQDF